MRHLFSRDPSADCNWLAPVTRRICAIGISGLLLAAQAGATGFPEARIPDAFGISIHGLHDPAREAAQIREAGFRVVRLDLVWQRIEKQRGVYDFSNTDALVETLGRANLRPLFVLIYSNSLYEQPVSVEGEKGDRDSKKTAAPRSDESRAAYAAFAAAAVKHYSTVNPIWEIWNEADRSGSWPPTPDPTNYARLAMAACSAMRAQDPSALIVGPGAADVPKREMPVPPLLATLLDADRTGCLDGISVHPYLNVDLLDRTPAVWDDMRALIAAHVSGKKSGAKLPQPLSSEWGLSTYRQGLTNDTQASYLVRMMLLNLSKAITVSIWYDWVDDGDDPHDPEHHFGMLDRSREPKPVFKAMKVMTTTLAGGRFTCSPTANAKHPDTTQLLFRMPDGANSLVAWSRDDRQEWRADENAVLSVDAGLPVSSAVDMFGDKVPMKRVDGKLLVGPGFQPIYLRLKESASASAICRTAQP